MKSPEELTRADLRVMYYTGRDSVNSAKVHHYRSGVMTPVGDIEVSQWYEYAEALVAHEHGETELLALIQNARSLPWLRNENEIRTYALEQYMRNESASISRNISRNTVHEMER